MAINPNYNITLPFKKVKKMDKKRQEYKEREIRKREKREKDSEHLWRRCKFDIKLISIQVQLPDLYLKKVRRHREKQRTKKRLERKIREKDHKQLLLLACMSSLQAQYGKVGEDLFTLKIQHGKRKNQEYLNGNEEGKQKMMRIGPTGRGMHNEYVGAIT